MDYGFEIFGSDPLQGDDHFRLQKKTFYCVTVTGSLRRNHLPELDQLFTNPGGGRQGHDGAHLRAGQVQELLRLLAGRHDRPGGGRLLRGGLPGLLHGERGRSARRLGEQPGLGPAGAGRAGQEEGEESGEG